MRGWIWAAFLIIFAVAVWRALSTPHIDKVFRRPRHVAIPPQPSTAPTIAPPIRQRAKPAWVVDAIVQLKAALPDYGCRKVADTFNRLHAKAGMTIGKTCVATIVSRHQYAIAAQRRYWRQHPPGLGAINHTWALDLTGKTDSAGQLHQILGILDHGSRRLLCLRALVNKTTFTLLGHLFLAIGQYGLPRIIRTDNETIFTSRLFGIVLRELGIRHRRSTPHSPWQNGRIERLFGSLKPIIDPLIITGHAALQSVLQSFAVWYNGVRPHQHLSSRTPLEAWCGIDPNSAPITAVIPFCALDGRLTGFALRRRC